MKSSIRRLCTWAGSKNCIWILWAGWFLFLIKPQLHKAIAGWGVLTWDLAATIARRGYAAVSFYYLPPLYTSLLAASFKSFGFSQLTARLVGVLCLLLLPLVMYEIIAGCVTRSRRPAAFAVALAVGLCSPAVIQGALLIDHPDTHLSALFIALFFMVLIRGREWRCALRVCVLGIVYCFCLWSKLTTALAIPLAVLLAGLLHRKRRECGAALTACAAGAFLFIVSWALFCFLFIGAQRFMEPLRYYSLVAVHTVFTISAGHLGKVFSDFLLINLWFSPLLVLLGIGVLLRIVSACRRAGCPYGYACLAAFLIVIAAGYGYANATFSSFPKYVLCALPLLGCLCGCLVSDQADLLKVRLPLLLTGSLLAVEAVVLFLLIRDPVYAVYLLRASPDAKIHARVLVSTGLLQSVPFLLAGLNFTLLGARFNDSIYKKVMLSALIVILAYNFSVAVYQRGADYSVNYAYGTRGAEELQAALEREPPGEIWSSIEGFLVTSKRHTFHGLDKGFFDEPRVLLEFLRAQKPHALIIGLPANTASQMRSMFCDEALQSYLRLHYRLARYGDYYLYTRV